MKFLAEELEGAIKLYELNLVTVMRFMALQRDQARLEGDRGRLVAEMARARAKVSETELQLLQLDQDAQTEVLKDLREAEAKIAELRERRAAAIDQLKRVDIYAPQTGFVHQLALHTIGGVVGPAETVMLIVPFSDSLIVEAKVAPQDIDQVRMGGLATVRIMAGNQRVAPDLNGAITHISADLTREQQGNQPAQSYFLVRVALGETEVRRLNDLKLVPGMPAEVFMQTQSRSPLRYLLKPVEEQIGRTFRER
jgi:HlyD family secretion protein